MGYPTAASGGAANLRPYLGGQATPQPHLAGQATSQPCLGGQAAGNSTSAAIVQQPAAFPVRGLVANCLALGYRFHTALLVGSHHYRVVSFRCSNESFSIKLVGCKVTSMRATA